MADIALLLLYVLGCLLVAAGVALIFPPAGLIVAGTLTAGSVVRMARSPAPPDRPAPGAEG